MKTHFTKTLGLIILFLLTACQKDVSPNANQTVQQQNEIPKVYAESIPNYLIQHLDIPVELNEEFQLSEINRVGYISGEKIFRFTFYIQVFQICYQNKFTKICTQIQTLSNERGSVIQEFPSKETLNFKKKVNYDFKQVADQIEKMENIPFDQRKFIQINNTDLFFELMMIKYVNLNQYLIDPNNDLVKGTFINRSFPGSIFVKINPFPEAQPLVMNITLDFGYYEFFDYDDQLIKSNNDDTQIKEIPKTSVGMLINYCVDGVNVDIYQVGFLMANYSEHCRFYNKDIKEFESKINARGSSASPYFDRYLDLNNYFVGHLQNDITSQFIQLHQSFMQTGRLTSEHYEFMEFLKREASKVKFGRKMIEAYQNEFIPDLLAICCKIKSNPVPHQDQVGNL